MQINKFTYQEVIELIRESFKISDHFVLNLYGMTWFSKELYDLPDSQFYKKNISIRWMKSEGSYLQRKSLDIINEDILLPPNSKTDDFCIYLYGKDFVESPIVKLKASFMADDGRIFGDFVFIKEDEDLFWSESNWVSASIQRHPDQERISWLLDAAQTDEVKRFIVNKLLPMTIK